MQLVMKRSIAIVEDSEDEPESMDSDSPGEEEVSFVWWSSCTFYISLKLLIL